MELANQQCTPCAGGIPPMPIQEAREKLSQIPGWQISGDGHWLERKFLFKDYRHAWQFVDRISQVVEQQGHHPDITFGWGYCRVKYQTHAIKGLHENDFIMAAKVSEVFEHAAHELESSHH